MIPAIRPTSKEAYDRSWKLEKDEENRFAERLGNAQRQRRRRRWNDLQEQQIATAPYSFENPAFNIITGSTNYILQELTTELREETLSHATQLELFNDRVFQKT